MRRLAASSRFNRLKTLQACIDAEPVLSKEHWQLAQWMADNYWCSLGEACASMVPSTLRIPRSSADLLPASGDRQPSPLVLNAEQQQAFTALQAALRRAARSIFLLHGVTGSGKTEVYLRAIDQALEQGRSAICLVPEIALTPQMVDRFQARFGEAAALWHSRLTPRQRGHAWHRLASGQARVVIGTRSAVFAPIRRVGLLILDEEHEPSYKQEQTPRYHAREVALARAARAKAVVILGSATPAVESYYAARARRYQLLKLTKRIEERPLPKVDVIDMRHEHRHRRIWPFSIRLQQALQRVVDRREQAILLLNRRGFSRVAQCPVCGMVMRCERCSVPLIYHAQQAQLTCHYCGFHRDPPEVCPACRKGYLRFRGLGTERIESALHQLFPATDIARMDRDSTKDRESHRRFYDAIKTQDIDLLVGTQMVAKGLDIPQVTLVGVISADTALNLPDFRAGEKTFDLLTQVAGRAGRGSQPGQVIVQTASPSHYAIRAASRHDYEAFYETEIQMRRRLRLPPFCHMVEVTVQGSPAARVEETARALGARLEKPCRRAGMELFGPAPHRVVQIRRTSRWRLIAKARQVGPILRVMREVLGPSRKFQGLPVIVDVNPL